MKPKSDIVFRVVWLLEELGAPYDVQVHKRLPTRRAPPELLGLHDLGKIIVDNSTNPPMLWRNPGQSLNTLLRSFHQTRLSRPRYTEKRKYTYWLHASEGSLAPPVIMKIIYGSVKDPSVKAGFEQLHKVALEPGIKRSLEFVEKELQDMNSLLGMTYSRRYPAVPDHCMSDIYSPGYLGPKTRAWIAKLRERPAFKHVSKLEFTRGSKPKL
ncbi:hypothetical protein BCR33DRAFT_711415 [Rhizoclosmatium globosum]|uniref:GST N-terminal domain-containing protein n=1 Tax=Rhizoclosmatium globosum TaxID=329046 RepID=A0A1Y2D1M7_9FUNG|nr:hypothetical protein BCR33DRAFT_711415 [Rhizoclosmatium globosum]|eukprot:ORY53026.1 hypothetical protein BCR33DRAFT_711415 [Rhizoclosmatium globosum]